MKNIQIAGLVIFLTGLLWGCKIGDDDQPQRETFSFSQGIDVVTFKKEYTAGDIIFMEVNVPGNTFNDLSTNTAITVGNATFGVATRAEIVAKDPIPAGEMNFDVSMQNGAVEKGDEFDQFAEAVFTYGCPSTDYALSLGLQVKEEGNYILILNDLDQLSLIFFTDESDCSITSGIPPDDADQAFVRFFFEEDDVNLDVFEEVVDGAQDPLFQYYRQLLTNKYAFFIKVR